MLPKTLMEQIADVVVLDVRYPNEWEAGHIEGARHIPRDDVEDHVDDLDRARPIVTVCRGGQRSEAAATELREKGFEAESLDGGMLAWAGEGFALVAVDGSPGTVAEPEEPPDDRPVEMQQLQNELLKTIFAVKEHFGDRQPTEEETRAFLKGRLIAEGNTAQDADQILDSPND